MEAQPLETNNFLALIGEVNELYFWTKVGAKKSVKYIWAAPVNHALAFYSRAGASALQYFPIEINGLSPLISP